MGGHQSEAPAVLGLTRAQRLSSGWSANLVQLGLGITQQIVLVPIFLQYWTTATLAAWLVLYSVGNLVLIADCGLQLRSINRFLAFNASVDCEGRTAQFYRAMLRIYVGMVVCFSIAALFGSWFFAPSIAFGFSSVPHFDVAFVMMTLGMLSTLPSSLASALFRARGLYGRAVKLQNSGMLISQVGQTIAVFATGDLLAVTATYATVQAATGLYFLLDAPKLFPFLNRENTVPSWRWTVGQFYRASPFAVATATDLGLVNLPVLIVSALTTDRLGVAQWGLIRIVVGLVRALSIQVTLPFAAELGQEYASGSDEHLRSLYARGSLFITVQTALVVSALLSFLPDFFIIWTHDSVPYNSVLATTLLIGAGITAPSIFALGFANYSNRSNLLVVTKVIQVAVFLSLAGLLIPHVGILGVAIAIVCSDVLVQFGLLGLTILRQTLQHPVRHLVFLLLIMSSVTLIGWAAGGLISWFVPGAGLLPLVLKCAIWLAAMSFLLAPFAIKRIRNIAIECLPH